MAEYIFKRKYQEKELSEDKDLKLEVIIEYDKDARTRGYYLIFREVIIEDRGDYLMEIVNIHEDYYKRLLLTEVTRKSKKAEKEAVNKALDFISNKESLQINDIYPILENNLAEEIVEDIINEAVFWKLVKDYGIHEE